MTTVPANAPAFALGEEVFFKGTAATTSQISAVTAINISINLNGDPTYIYTFTDVISGGWVTGQETDFRHVVALPG